MEIRSQVITEDQPEMTALLLLCAIGGHQHRIGGPMIMKYLNRPPYCIVSSSALCVMSMVTTFLRLYDDVCMMRCVSLWQA